jgi:hypothetical protein
MCSRLLANLDASQTNKQTKQSQKKQRKQQKNKKTTDGYFILGLSLLFS